MIYLIVDIFNYEQIIKIDPELDLYLQNIFYKIKTNYICDVFTKRNFLTLIKLGHENTIKPAQIAECAFKIYKNLLDKKDELFGFSILIQLFDNEGIDIVERKMCDSLLSIDDDKGIWIDDKAKSLLDDLLYFKKISGLWKIQSLKNPLPRQKEQEELAHNIRYSVVKRILNSLSLRLNGNCKAPGLLLIGEHDTGVKKAVKEAIRIILGQETNALPSCLYSLSAQNSKIDPFLCSIDIKIFQDIPAYLKTIELQIWNEKYTIINYLKNIGDNNKCFDHLSEDFYTVYNLYLTGYIRMMQEKFLPAILIFENIENYHPDSLKLLNILLKDFMRNPCFLPILTTNKNLIPNSLKNINLKTVRIMPPGWKDVRYFTSCIFPGVSLSRAISKKINKLCSGQITPILHYLLFLESKGKIIKKEEYYVFLSFKEKHIKFLTDTAVVSLNILKSLHHIKLDLLYTVYIAEGLISIKDIFNFFKLLGIGNQIIEKTIKSLALLGFISEVEPIVPLLPFLQTGVENIMGKRAIVIRKELLTFIITKWKKGQYFNLTLLFYFFIKNKCFDLACDILMPLIKLKLDETDLSGVIPLLDIDDIVDKRRLNSDIKQRLNLILNAGKLRYYLLKGNIYEAETIVNDIQEKLKSFKHCRERGHVFLRLSSFYRAKYNIYKALENSKYSLLEFQDFGTQKDKAITYIELGSNLLAEGRLEEALEYINLSDRLLTEDCFEKIRCLYIKGIIFFLLGKLFKIQSVLTESIRLAGKLRTRELELFLLFFEGRVTFRIGEYSKAHLLFQRCLNMAKLYSIKEAIPMLYCWLARSNIYFGNISEGIIVLEKIQQNPETLFFLAEAYHFTGKNKKALEYLNTSLNNKNPKTCVSGEYLLWNNSYSLIEGHCLILENKMPIVDRFIRTFRAYILSLEDNRKESITEFRNLSPQSALNVNDIYSSYYYYLYYISIPRYQETESIDSLTILNKATALLQDWANRISSPLIKSLFLNNNLWNKRLMQEAKKNNLV